MIKMEAKLLKLLIIPGLMEAMLLAGVFFVFLPKVMEISQMNTQAVGLQKSTADLSVKRNYLLSMDEADLKKKSELLEMALPKNRDMYYLLNVIGQVASQEGYAVDSFGIDPGVFKGDENNSKKAELIRIPVSAVLFGPKENFVDLVGVIERSLPVLSIENLDYKDRGGSNQLSITVMTSFAPNEVDPKITDLTMNDLMMTPKEVELIGQLSSFKKIEGIMATDQGLDSGKTYTKYIRNNPFNP